MTKTSPGSSQRSPTISSLSAVTEQVSIAGQQDCPVSQVASSAGCDGAVRKTDSPLKLLFTNLKVLIRLRSGGLQALVLSHCCLPEKPTVGDLRDALKETPLAGVEYDCFLESWSRMFYRSNRDLYNIFRRLDSNRTLERILRDEIADPGSITLVLEQCRSEKYSNDPTLKAEKATQLPTGVLVLADQAADPLANEFPPAPSAPAVVRQIETPKHLGPMEFEPCPQPPPSPTMCSDETRSVMSAPVPPHYLMPAMGAPAHEPQFNRVSYHVPHNLVHAGQGQSQSSPLAVPVGWRGPETVGEAQAQASPCPPEGRYLPPPVMDFSPAYPNAHHVVTAPQFWHAPTQGFYVCPQGAYEHWDQLATGPQAPYRAN